MADDEGTQKLKELVEDARIAMLTTEGEDGRLLSRPMAVQEVEFDGDLWFVSGGSTEKTSEIAHNSPVNVSFSSGSSWVSIAGDAELVHDQAKAEQLWNKALDAWFPDGPTTPGITLIKVHADSAEYWDAPGGRVATLLSYAKSRATGKPYSGGENETVEL